MNVRNLSLLIGAALFSVTASAAVFTDDFSSGTAADAGYYRFGTTGTTLAVAVGSLDFAIDGTAASRSGVIKSFAEQTLAVGDSITFSFDINSRTLANSQNHSFRWAIGNLGNPSSVTGVPVTGDLTSASPFASGTREMYMFSAGTGATTGFGAYSPGQTSPVHNAVTGFAGFTGPGSIATTGADSVSLTITRTAATDYSLEQTAFGSASSGTLTGDGTNIFNTLAFSFNNAGAYHVSLDNVSVSVIPEPSTMVLLGIALMSALVFKRRKA